jgi:hypothetical protein
MSAPEALAVAKCELEPGQKDTLVEPAQLHFRFRGVVSVGEVRPTSLLRRSEKVRNGHPSLELWN